MQFLKQTINVAVMTIEHHYCSEMFSHTITQA